MRHEFYSERIFFMLKYGYRKIEDFGNYIIANDKYFYPYSWLENDYIFFNKICGMKEVKAK